MQQPPTGVISEQVPFYHKRSFWIVLACIGVVFFILFVIGLVSSAFKNSGGEKTTTSESLYFMDLGDVYLWASREPLPITCSSFKTIRFYNSSAIPHSVSVEGGATSPILVPPFTKSRSTEGNDITKYDLNMSTLVPPSVTTDITFELSNKTDTGLFGEKIVQISLQEISLTHFHYFSQNYFSQTSSRHSIDIQDIQSSNLGMLRVKEAAIVIPQKVCEEFRNIRSELGQQIDREKKLAGAPVCKHLGIAFVSRKLRIHFKDGVPNYVGFGKKMWDLNDCGDGASHETKNIEIPFAEGKFMALLRRLKENPNLILLVESGACHEMFDSRYDGIRILSLDGKLPKISESIKGAISSDVFDWDDCAENTNFATNGERERSAPFFPDLNWEFSSNRF